MKKEDKKLYGKIIKECQRRWLKDRSIFDADKNRYILDLSDSFIMFYPSSGKILLSTGTSLKIIFRDTETTWMLTEDIENLVKRFNEHD